MDRLIRFFSECYQDRNFRQFQNNLAREVYDTLANSYSRSANEVTIVTDLCKTINRQKFKSLRFFADKIHGSRSYVEFYNQDKPTTKELADMVIISVATRDKEIVYEKIAFVQNKKEKDGIWEIDPDQLYLLHNFPTFKGTKGLFKRNFTGEIIFQNHSDGLGNYGLFQSPGEMMLTNASTVHRLQQNCKISQSDIRKYASDYNIGHSPWFPMFYHPFWKEMVCMDIKHFLKYGLPFLQFPFLGNSAVSFNIYEIIRNWSLFNIGEVVTIEGLSIDTDLKKFSRLLLRNTGASEYINLYGDNDQFEFDNNLAVLVSHVNLDEM
jgi:hypothetical protein